MPEGVVSLAENLAWRFKMSGSGWTNPEKRDVSVGGVGGGKPFVHGGCGEWPGERGAEGE